MNILHDSLQLIDIPSIADRCTDKWYNRTLCKVNDSVVRLGILHGAYHWHKHEKEDEFFFRLLLHHCIADDAQALQGEVRLNGFDGL